MIFSIYVDQRKVSTHCVSRSMQEGIICHLWIRLSQKKSWKELSFPIVFKRKNWWKQKTIRITTKSFRFTAEKDKNYFNILNEKDASDNKNLWKVVEPYFSDRIVSKDQILLVENDEINPEDFWKNNFGQISNYMESFLSRYQCGFRKCYSAQLCILFICLKNENVLQIMGKYLESC